MKEEQATYSTGDMLKLINTAATNLLLKEKKVSLEARIRKQREELEYTGELLARARKKVADLAPEILEAEERTRESREHFALLKAQRDGLNNELERLREIERKAPLLQQMSAEVTALLGNVAKQQDRYDRLRSVCDGKIVRKEELEFKKRHVMSDLQASKERLALLRTENEHLTCRLSGICGVGYLEKLRADGVSVGEALVERVRGIDDSEFPTSLIAFLQNARRVDAICRAVDGINNEAYSSPSDFKAIRDAGILSGMKEDINRQADEFLAIERRKVQDLHKRKSIIDGAEERLELLKKDDARIEDELRSEKEFGVRSQSLIKELDSELTAQAVELERVKKEAERLLTIKEFAGTLTAAIEPSIEYMRNINSRLRFQIEDYKRAFYGVAKVLKTL
ncbi:MAG: hypothetical protein HQL08_08350 [Nitrospirae bacterium]|nr:hypothetical protein [Nitrospirota bacterium]